MSRREILRNFADRFLEFINSRGVNPDNLSSFLAKDVVTPLSYPGATSGYEGVKGVFEKLHSALSDYRMKLVTPVIDEEECRVVFFVKSQGVQTGEWRGIPGSGIYFDHYGFLMLKVNLERGLIEELNMLFQDTLSLKQIGIIPYGYE